MAALTSQEASSSSPAPYHVFLSFRGEDIRKNFIDHLYTALEHAGFLTFRDDYEIARGEDIKSELQKAITESKILIVVFSKSYAFSRWCLDELVMILECKRTSKHEVLPVFYDVDPSQVRKQTGIFGTAFARHVQGLKEQVGGNNEWMDKVQRWKAALREAADIPGMSLLNQADGYESKFIKKIVSVVEDKLNHRVLYVPPNLIGIHHRAEIINLWLRDGSVDVGIVGIWGMGGIGKTTIAKFVYSSNFGRFEGSSFLSNIREVSQQCNGLVRLQRKFLFDILNHKKEKIFNVDEGIVNIKDAISSRRVFVVLDDVDRVDQLNAILGKRDWFCPGSKIIITTRDKHLLKALEVYKVHEIEPLDTYESLKLFSWHAFKQDHPVEGYMEHSRRIVHHSGGLPLALEVLGSSLYGRSIDEWESAQEKWEEIPTAQLFRVLKISFDSLHNHDQDLFLHIACFFVGKDKDCTVRILDGCGLYAMIGIQNLIHSCLLTIDKHNKIMMHQLLRDMGREIVRQESPKELGKRSRLWHHEDSFTVLREKTGSKTIEGLVLDMHALKEVNSALTISSQNDATEHRFQELLDVHWIDNTSKNSNEIILETSAFVRMHKLRLLQLSYVQLSGSYEEFPKGLRWLCWRGFPLESIPNDFPVGSLVALDLRYSSLKQVLKETKFLGLLKILNLSHSHNLAKTPDFSGLPNLERLILKDCTNLVEVHTSIGILSRLVFLNLKDCKNLRQLPSSIICLKSLEALTISGCLKLNVLMTKLRKLESLKVFAADGIAINQLLSTTGEVKSWQEFVWSFISMPRKSPVISWALLPHSMVTLSLADCNISDDAFPRDFSSLPLLQNLNLSKNPICSLPDCIRGHIRLQTLQLESCGRLRSLVGIPSVKKLNVSECMSLERITFQSLLPASEIAFAQCYSLLEFQPCFKIETIGEVDTEMINLMRLPALASLENIEVDLASGTLGLFRTKTCPTFQGLHEYGLFSTFFPGREVPSWFNHRRMGSSISFNVPSFPNLRVRGMDVCSVYAFSNAEKDKLPHPLLAEIRNKSKDLKWIYGPSCLGVPRDDGNMIWLSHWKLGNQFDGGDKVRVSILMDVGFEVKECGIKLLYEQEERLGLQENTFNPSHQRVSDGDLSRYQVMTGTYFLCDVISKGYGGSTLHSFDLLFGDSDKNTAVEDASLVSMEIKSSKRLKVVVDDGLIDLEKDPKFMSSKRMKVVVDDGLVDMEKDHGIKSSKRVKVVVDDNMVGTEKDPEMKSSKRMKVVVDASMADMDKDPETKSPKLMEVLPAPKSVKGMMAQYVANSISSLVENNKEEYSGQREVLKLAGDRVLEAPSLQPGEKEELEEMRQKAEDLRWKSKVLKRRTDFILLILSYPMKSEAQKESQPCLGIKFSSINQQIRKFEASISDKYNRRCSNESPEDINRKIQELFHEVEGKLAEYDFDMAAYLPLDMVENMRDPPETDTEHSASRTEPVELIMPPTSTKSENFTRPNEDGMLLCPPQIFNLAISSAVHQIAEYFEDRRFGKIGISGSGWEEVAKALKDHPKIRNTFEVIQSVSLSQNQSIKELLMSILERALEASKISTSARLLLLVDCIDQQIDIHDLDFTDDVCVVLKTRPQKVNETMTLNLEIRMEDHLLPWNLFCKNVSRVLDHSSTLQQKAVSLIEKCRGHLLAIILLAGALKDVSDASVWERALHELMWQPSYEMRGMNVVMINVLRFIWERMGTTTRNCVKSCLLQSIGKKISKPLVIYYAIKNGWIETTDEGEYILEKLATSFLLENVGRGFFRMREETRLVLVNVFIPGKDPAYLKHGDLGLTETPKAEEWVAREINLMNNMLSELPASPNCPFLVKLFLQGNYDLMVIPPLFFECMPVLQVLDLSYTSIKSLPKSISKLVALREFFLRSCDMLMELPPEIGALRNLEGFDLQGTKLMYLPKEIGKIVSLTRLKVSFYECADLCLENKDVTTIPRMALSNLSQLHELSIDVHPDGDWWDVEVKAITNELCNLKSLRHLNLYLPDVELLKDLRLDNTSLMYPALERFRFIVGHHEHRFISRLPRKVKEEFDNSEKFEKGLKYINGEGIRIPIEITKVLKHADAFSLERHWTTKNLSDFGLENMDKLKFCLLVECNEFKSILDYQGDCEEDDGDQSEHDSEFDGENVLWSLQYLSIHYMKNLESICKGPVQKGCLANLNSLALHTCPNLTTIFTIGMLRNLRNLKEIIVEDCSKIKSLVSHRSSSIKLGHFLPSLKKISLIHLPELVSISSGLCIAPYLQSVVIFYCPKLKTLSSMEVSSKDLKIIKGENEWWDALKWHESDLSNDYEKYLASKFISLSMDGDLMAQLTED